MKNITKFEGMVNLCVAKGKVLAKMAKLSVASQKVVMVHPARFERATP